MSYSVSTLSERLNSHPLTSLRQVVARSNILNYSKLKKPELIALMLKFPTRFNHIPMRVRGPRAPRRPRVVESPVGFLGQSTVVPTVRKPRTRKPRTVRQMNFLGQSGPETVVPAVRKPRKPRVPKAVKSGIKSIIDNMVSNAVAMSEASKPKAKRKYVRKAPPKKRGPYKKKA
jgi:hypothetical protein